MKPRWFWIVSILLVLPVVGFMLLCGFRHGGFCAECATLRFHRINTGERSPSTSLKTLATAQADFRANDRDWDGLHQFWRADVSGLYTIIPRNVQQPTPYNAIKLIELSVASADASPASSALSTYAIAAPKTGYWFRAMRHADEDPKALDPDRFAFCAVPATPAGGKYVFIVDERNTIYRAEAKGRTAIDVFSKDEELKTSWAKID